MCSYLLDHKNCVKVINGTADKLCLVSDNGHRPRWLELHSEYNLVAVAYK